LKTPEKAAKIVPNMSSRRERAAQPRGPHLQAAALPGRAQRGLLLIGGEGPSRVVLEPILSLVGFVVAADAGFDLAARLAIEPDLLVGDLDSVAGSEALARFPKDRIRRFPVAKDETDTEIGLRLLHELGYGHVTIAGGGGGRLDHLLGILGLFERENAPQAWYTSAEHVALVDRELAVRNCRGQTVSFFPLGAGADGLSSEGLRWPLNGLSWRRGEASISNEVVGGGFRVRVGRGRLLMVRTLGEKVDAGEN
jgi:thiamine pyrophosphokinase